MTVTPWEGESLSLPFSVAPSLRVAALSCFEHHFWVGGFSLGTVLILRATLCGVDVVSAYPLICKATLSSFIMVIFPVTSVGLLDVCEYKEGGSCIYVCNV